MKNQQGLQDKKRVFWADLEGVNPREREYQILYKKREWMGGWRSRNFKGFDVPRPSSNLKAGLRSAWYSKKIEKLKEEIHELQVQNKRRKVNRGLKRCICQKCGSNHVLRMRSLG